MIDSVDEISNTRKEYLKKALNMRHDLILKPSLEKVIKEEKE